MHNVAPVPCCIFDIVHFGIGAPLKNAAPRPANRPLIGVPYHFFERGYAPAPAVLLLYPVPARHGRSFSKQVEGSETGTLLIAQSPIKILDIHDSSQDLTHFLVQVEDFTPFLTQVDGAQNPTTEYETTPLLHTQAVERTVKTVTVDSSLLLGARQGGETPSHTDPNTSTSLPGLQLGAGLTFLPMYGMATTNFLF